MTSDTSSKSNDNYEYNPIKVILVDDQKLIRDGIRSLFALTKTVEIIAECSDGSEVIDSIQCNQPDVLLLDLSMPKMNGIDTLKQLQTLAVKTPTLVLTTFNDSELILQSIQYGAKGFLLKDVELETLLEAIEAIHEGKTYYQPAITSTLLNSSKSLSSELPMPDSIDKLSEKELEVLRLMAAGYSNKEIASMLNKSEGTIKNHVSNVLSKFRVRDRTRAVLLAIEHGIL